MEKNMKSYKKMLAENGVFYTDENLSKMLLSYIDNDPKTVYDPTCGQGNLLKPFADDIEKYGQELDENELKKAEASLVNFHGYAGNTLEDDGFKDKKFDAIVGNYPFSVKWNPDQLKDDPRFSVAPALAPKSKADYAFILHMLHHLKDDGVIVTICFPGILYRGNSEAKIRQWLVEQNYIERVVAIEGGHFVDTSIATVLLVIRKNKKTTDIIFEDTQTGESRVVPFDEVKDHKFTLSVNTYVVKETVKEEIDIHALNKECTMLALSNFLVRLKQDLVVAEYFEHDEVWSERTRKRITVVEQWIKEEEELNNG